MAQFPYRLPTPPCLGWLSHNTQNCQCYAADHEARNARRLIPWWKSKAGLSRRRDQMEAPKLRIGAMGELLGPIPQSRAEPDDPRRAAVMQLATAAGALTIALDGQGWEIERRAVVDGLKAVRDAGVLL